MDSFEVHGVMVEKGFWDDVVAGRITHQQKILEQVLHVCIEAMEWLVDSKESDEAEAADIVIVLLDLCGGLGWHIELGAIMPSTDENYLLTPVCKLANNARKLGAFTREDVINVISVAYGVYDKRTVIKAVEDKMLKNRQRPRKYGKEPFAMTLRIGHFA